MRFKKPVPIRRIVRSAPAYPLGNLLVLSTEDRAQFDLLAQEYMGEHQPRTTAELDLVHEMLAAKWRQMRCWAVEVALLDLTMERMAPKVAQEFAKVDNSVRTALAFIEQAGAEGALALNQREEARLARMWHRAFKLLRELRKQNLPSEPGQLFEITSAGAGHPEPAPAQEGSGRPSGTQRAESDLSGPTPAKPRSESAEPGPGRAPGCS